MNEVNKKTAVHNIILEGRRKLSVSGVTDVDKFDESTVMLYTSMGELTVCGTDLHVNDLSVENGEMNIEGEIRSIVYGDPDRHSPLTFLGKIFR
ncbi:MAG: YabP/YqfC family sporulation protein [Oscillospiraceae bacterium]|nr:YabP/YqfC family sporulation protein [Oscillospiraceae bacterium]